MLQSSITGSAEYTSNNMTNVYTPPHPNPHHPGGHPGVHPGVHPGGHSFGRQGHMEHEPQLPPHGLPQSPMPGNHSYTYGASVDSQHMSSMERYSDKDLSYGTTPSMTPTQSYSTARSDHTSSMRTDSLYRSSKRGRLMPCKVHMLDDTVMSVEVPHNASGGELFVECCRHINLYELDYFGIEYYTKGNKMVWVEPEKPLTKQVDSPKKILFHFSVKFYLADPGQLHDEFTKYLFGLQIKKDLANGRLPCSENTAALMASYILQAEVGDYNPNEHEDGRYISQFRFVPNQQNSMETKIQEYHKNHIGQTPADADFNLLDVARRLEMYGVRLYPARDYENVQLNLAVCHQGVLVFQSNARINTFSWAKIRKVSFKRKRFLIKLHPEGFGYPRSTVEFLMGVRNDCKRFWKACVEHHTFFRLSKPGRPRTRNRLMSRGSTFRFSGKTQKQVVETLRTVPSRPTMSLNASRTSSRSLGAPRTTTPLAIDMTETIVSDHQSTPNLTYNYQEGTRHQNGTPQSESASSPPSSTPVTPKHDNSRITIHKGQSSSSITYEYTVTEDHQKQVSPTEIQKPAENELVSTPVESQEEEKQPTANGDTQPPPVDAMSEPPISYTHVEIDHSARSQGALKEFERESVSEESDSEEPSSGREKIVLWEPNRLLVYSYGEEKNKPDSNRGKEGDIPLYSMKDDNDVDGGDSSEEEEGEIKVSDTLDEVLRIVSKFPNTDLEDDDLYERGQTPSIGGGSPDSPVEFQLSVQTSDFKSFRKERRLFFPSSETVTSSLQEVNNDLDTLERDLDMDIEKQAEIQKYVQDVTDSVIALQNIENLDISPGIKSPTINSPTSPSRFVYKQRPSSLGVSPKRESTSTFDISPQAKEMFNVNTGVAVVNQKHTIILKSHSSDDEGSRNDSYVSELKIEIDDRGRISIDEDSLQSGDGIPSDVAEVSYSEVFSDSEVSFGRLENENGQESSTPQQQSLPLSRTSLSDIESESSEDEAVYQYKLKEAKMSRMKASLTDTSSSVTSSDEDDDQGGRQEDDQKGELDRHAGGLILSPKAGGTGKELFADLQDPPSPVYPDASANSDDFD